jgi:hypothetical protein
VLYRYDQVPLVRHMGELLTVTVLGGACFGLPTTLVSERERGVWRRYRLAPVATGSLVASTLVARYLLLLVAGLLQLGLALALGMPWPQHPAALWAAFTAAAWAFLGLGLVIAMLANTVPAVQALGQCLFLPMLIVGGVAVPLARLPAWAQQVAAFFPGRYAVEAIQAAVMGPGLRAVGFSLAALGAIGAAATLAGAKLFRWDAAQRVPRGAAAWVTVALAAWVGVGLAATSRGYGRPVPRVPAVVERTPAPAAPAAPDTAPPTPVAPTPTLTPAEQAALTHRSRGRSRGEERPRTRSSASSAPPRATPGAAPETPMSAATWRDVTAAEIDRETVDHLPPDSGIVTPIAEPGEPPDPNQATLLDFIRGALPAWAPGRIDDPVQRVRNYLYVAGAADLQQLTLERHIPLLVLERLERDVPRDQLLRILYWIAAHPGEGPAPPAGGLRALRLDPSGLDEPELRNRAAIYAAKLLHRLKAAPKAPADAPRP